MKPTLLAALLFGAAAVGGCVMEEDGSLSQDSIGTTEEEIEIGFESGDNPSHNAVVRILNAGSSCTGTLVAPDKVLTAAHCNWDTDLSKADGQWHRAPTTAQVRFGPSQTSPVATASASYFTVVGVRPEGWVEDMALIQLDEPVAPDLAIPRDVLLTRPSFSSATSIFEFGYGGGRDRRWASGNNYRDWVSDSTLPRNWMAYRPFSRGTGIGDRDTNVEAGDSGGPMFFGSIDGPLVSVLGWWDPSGVTTYGPGGAGHPNVVDWLGRTLFEGEDFGFVWAYSATGVYNVVSSYSHNSSGATNNVANLGTGYYRVTFPESARSSSAAFQVVAYGSDASYCKLDRTDTAADSLSAYVRCFTHWGTPVNTQFVVFYVRGHDHGGPGLAYASVTSNAVDSYWNSAGDEPTVSRLSTGRYSVTFPGQSTYKSHVQVTARGTSADHCKVAGWGSSVTVQCYNHAGNPADENFHVILTTNRTIHGASGGHVWANNDSSSSYTPMSYYQHNSTGATNTAGKDGDSYWVQFPGVSYQGSTSLVTAYGNDASYCKVGGWGYQSGGMRMTVRCFDHAGSPTESRFDAAFLQR